ncbi:MAG: LacI family transcriptional regulator [Caldilinea sp. CFX5]|nr:LacI family transcriptional regulator [Caldilinea sp. CFX5]
MALTLQEIAKTLNVSSATVSRALNGKAGVSAEMRRKVLELAGELHYQPNPVAQQLATAKAYAVAFVIRRQLIRVDNPFYDRIMMGVELELEKQGYHLVAITIDEDTHRDNTLPPGLDSRRLDGLIIAGPELSGRMMMRLLALGLPTVLVGNMLPNVAVDAVASKNREGGYRATKHLIEHGHQQIAFLSGPTDWSPVQERTRGYLEALQEHNLAHTIIYQSGLRIANGYAALQELLAQHPTVTAVFASNDPMAIGALQAAKEAGRSVPNDLALIGFDNIPWAETTDPPLTTVYIHKQQMGKLAARRLLDLLQNGPEPAVFIGVENELVIRRSCGCVAD